MNPMTTPPPPDVLQTECDFIQMKLFTDGHGSSLAFSLLPGNANEQNS